MSWARNLETGYGTTRFRLVIHGHPDEFVSDESMERVASVGVRARLALLNSATIKLSERATLVDAKTEGSGFSAKIIDSRGRATLSLTAQPTARTLLQSQGGGDPGKLTSSAVTITVLSTDGFPSAGYIWLDGEVIAYTGKTSTTFTGCSRGQFDTKARAHYYDATGAEAREPEITNGPVTMEGRRATLWAYGDGDNPLGLGTKIWRGVVSSQPRYNGTSYSILIDPITRLLKQTIGGFLDLPVTIRGIYYSHANPLVIRCGEATGNDYIETPIARTFKFQMCGFWETQAAFLVAVNTELAARATAASFTGVFRAIAHGDSWAIHVRTPAADPRFPYLNIVPESSSVQAVSMTDGYFRDLPRDLSSPDGAGVTTVSASADYIYTLELSTDGSPLKRPGTVPRTCLGVPSAVGLTGFSSAERVDVSPALFPPDRLYLDVTPDTRWQQLVAEWKANWSGAEETVDREVIATDSDFADRWIRLADSATAGAPFFIATAENLPELEFLVQLSTGSIAEFITALVADSIELANLGLAPDLESDDFNLSTPSALEVSAASRGILDRVYAFTGSQDLEEVLVEDLKMYGAFIYTTSAGAMSFRLLRHATQVEVPGAEITPSKHVVGDNWLHYEGQPLGVYNTIVIKTGYDAIEDDHLGREWIVRDQRAFGRTPIARTLEIAPLSRESVEVTYADVIATVSRIIGMFAGEYEILRVDVTPQLFGVLLGDVVAVTSPKVPAGDGSKGIEEKRGIVVSREWQLTKDGGVGSLEILMTNRALAGYSPSAIILSGVDLGSEEEWRLTLDDSDFPEGTTAADFFQVGDLIRVAGFGRNVAAEPGTVTIASGNVITVQLTTPITVGSSDSFLSYRQPSAIPLVHADPDAQVQHAYGAIASSVGIITYDGFTAPYRVFAP